MMRTAVNITGDSMVSLINSKSEKSFNKSIFEDPKAAYDYTSISLFLLSPFTQEPSYTFQDFFPINSKANANMP